ncbi:unnamed protein product, partial [Choristocarpus tenellus]
MQCIRFSKGWEEGTESFRGRNNFARQSVGISLRKEGRTEAFGRSR